MSVDEESYEEHVLQNNQRLLSIAANLRESAQFAAACSELTQWCSDPRAYTPHFEDNLVGALQICVENGTKDGFDFTLAHQLITCCFQHRKLLSKESAVRINRWYEQYRRIKKNGGKRKRKSEMPPVDPGGLEQITVTDSGCTSSMWPQGGPMGGTTPMTSPGYHQQMMMGPGGYPQQGPFPPMDPTGARPPGYVEGSYEQQAATMQYQMMMRQRAAVAQQQQAAAARRGAGGMVAPQGYDPTMYPIPMGANSVPGQTQPLLRMPSQPGPGYPPMMGAGRGGPLMSPVYPQGNSHQMIKASPPVLFSNLQQQQPQSQPVMSYPNPHAMPPAYPQQEMQMVCLPWNGHLVNPFSPPDGMHHYQTTFSVTPDMYVQLSQSHQLNLLLKSYSGQDETGTQRTIWPVRPGTNEPAVQISINGNVVPVTKDRSAMVKGFVKQGENKLEIQCIPMPYKHYYMIQPVHIMPFSRFTEELFTRQQRSQHTSEHFKTKLINKGNNSTVVISLLDGRTGKRLKYPARSQKCQHIAAFELGDVVISQSECNQLLCPVQGCNTNFQLAEIELDLFLGDVIRHVVTNNIQASEAILEPNGCYRLSDGGDSTSTAAASRKRSATTNDDANSHSLKRIKSEQFPQQNSGASPFPSVHSLPGSMLSPFGNNVSPKKEIMSPPVGSGTPQPQKDEAQSLPGASTLTSPPGVPVINNGSVDSANGSAPYTPASMNGTTTAQAAPQQVEAHHNSLSNLENLDILEPFRPDIFGVHSPIEIEKYLQDGDLMSGCHKYELSDQTLIDLVDILNQDAKKTWGVDLKTIELQLTPLIMKN